MAGSPTNSKLEGNSQKWSENFVQSIIRKCSSDKGYAARLKRSDNPATEYQSWETLVAFGVDLEQEHQRLPFATIGAAIAKAKVDHNGTQPLGRAIARCYEDGAGSDQAKARLRRLLACSDLAEVCRILRPLFSLIQSKTNQPLNYVRLLGQLRRFSFNQQQIKAQWAQEFYRSKKEQLAEEAK